MSYGDVENLKRTIRSRLEEATREIERSFADAGISNSIGGQIYRELAGSKKAVSSKSIQQRVNPNARTKNGASRNGEVQNTVSHGGNVSMKNDKASMRNGTQRNGKTSMRNGQIQGEAVNGSGQRSATDKKNVQENCKHGMPIEKPQPPQFEKYPCGHPYPHMTVRQQLKEDLNKKSDKSERIDRLRYSLVMSELLSEPVCRQRRHRRRRGSM